MEKLSDSYARTLTLLDEGKTGEAASEFKRQFVPALKKLYAEAAEVYPPRFAKMDTWCKWTKALYVWTRRSETALDKLAAEGDATIADVQEQLRAGREHFYVLHQKAQTLKSNDYIYAAFAELSAETPNVEALKAAIAGLDEAAPAFKAKAEPGAYAQAKAAWLATATPLLDSAPLSPTARDQLRAATEPFYRAYGIQFE